MSARGIVRSGSRVSSAAYVTMCQPPNANRPATRARRKPRGWIVPSDAGMCGAPIPNSSTSSTPIAAIFVIVSAVCTVLPGRTPT